MLQLFTYQNEEWYECGKQRLQNPQSVQLDPFGLFVFESDLRQLTVHRFMDFKVV